MAGLYRYLGLGHGQVVAGLMIHGAQPMVLEFKNTLMVHGQSHYVCVDLLLK